MRTVTNSKIWLQKELFSQTVIYAPAMSPPVQLANVQILNRYIRGVTKKCRLSWLTNSTLVYELKWGEAVRGRVSVNEYSCAHGAQINFEDLTP
jgi:hypothetical protein